MHRHWIVAWQGRAGQGRAGQGKARQGKSSQVKSSQYGMALHSGHACTPDRSVSGPRSCSSPLVSAGRPL